VVQDVSTYPETEREIWVEAHSSKSIHKPLHFSCLLSYFGSVVYIYRERSLVVFWTPCAARWITLVLIHR